MVAIRARNTMFPIHRHIMGTTITSSPIRTRLLMRLPRITRTAGRLRSNRTEMIPLHLRLLTVTLFLCLLILGLPHQAPLEYLCSTHTRSVARHRLMYLRHLPLPSSAGFANWGFIVQRRVERRLLSFYRHLTSARRAGPLQAQDSLVRPCILQLFLDTARSVIAMRHMDILIHHPHSRINMAALLDMAKSGGVLVRLS